MSEPFSTLLKASEAVKSVLDDLSNNIPFILGSLAAIVFISFIPADLLPDRLQHFRGIFMTIGVFIVFYFLFLWWVHTRKIRQSIFLLNHIAEDEKVILREFMRQKKSVGYFSIEDGAAFNLVNKGILTLAVQSFTRNNVPVAIQPFIFEILLKKPSIIGLKSEEIGIEKPEKAQSGFPEKTLKTF